MIDHRLLLSDLEGCVTKLGRRGVLKKDVIQAKDLTLKRNQTIVKLEQLRQEKNKLSHEFSHFLAKKDTVQLEKIKKRLSQIKPDIENKKNLLSLFETELETLLLNLPNFPDDAAPDGDSSKDNVEILRENFNENFFQSKEFLPHWDIMDELDVFDQKRAGKISGSMFVVLKGSGAKLLRALIAFAFDIFEKDYTEYVVPSLVNSASFQGTGQLPKFAEEAYHMEKDDLWAIPTGEVPLTALHREEILRETQLPLKYMTCTSCFRREAGAAGHETRGLQRLHEFYKVELVKICKPSCSKEELQSLLQDALKPIKLLKLPHRVVDTCAKDLTFSSARVYDIEVYSPGVQSWLEVSSVGLFTDYQSRRSQIRCRAADKHVFFPHTLNGSGLATPRVFAAILENYREKKGKVKVPSALVKYMGGEYL